MKKITIAITLIILYTTVYSQAYDEGDNLLNLGVGIGTPYFGAGYKSQLPVNPTLVYEKSISDNISAGAAFSYASSKLAVYENYNWKFNALYVGSRLSYHFPLKKKTKIDPYIGGGLGYVLVTVSDDFGGAGGASSGVGYTVFGGSRLYFGKKTSLYGELGYGSLSVLNIGLSFKI